MSDEDETVIIEDIGPGSWQVRQVFAKYGLAMYHGQVLEHGIVNLLLWSGIADGICKSAEETETVTEALFEQTMGSLKRLLMERRIDLAHIEGDLIRAVSLRNFLAHRYFRERASAFLTHDGRDQMLEELDQAVSFFQEVDGRLDPVTMRIAEEFGILDKMPEAREKAADPGFGQPLPGLT